MKTQKFKSYLVLALIVFVIYLILYLVVFSFSGEGKLNYWPMLSKGVILALVIPLFSKKFSPIPPVHDEKSAKKGKKSLLIQTSSHIGFIVILSLVFYLAIKIIY